MNLAEAVLMAADALETSLEESFKNPTDSMLVKHHIRFIRTLVSMAGEGDKAAVPGTPEGRLVKVLGGGPLPLPSQKAVGDSLTAPAEARDPWQDALKKGEGERLRKLVERQEAVAREELKATILREEAGSGMAEASGGSLDGTYVPIDPAMPVGAKTLLGSQVYVLRADRKLHYSEEETVKYGEGRKRDVPV
jgi:hypothetical protein